MKAEVIATGDEILSGAVIDTNSAYIAQKLEENGIKVTRHISINDDLHGLVSIFQETAKRSNFAIVTGGLGPTHDDITAEAAAKASCVGLVHNLEAQQSIDNYFEKRKKLFNYLNKKQAMLPDDAICFDNPVGTAPGFALKIEECLFCFMPGVPHEMKYMLENRVIPFIKKENKNNLNIYITKTISSFGLPESAVNEKLFEFSEQFPNIKLGLRAKFPEIQIKLYANGDDQKILDNSIDQATQYVRSLIGKYIFSYDQTPMEVEVGKLLQQSKTTIAIAESCTGGLISDLITNVPGSSDYFLCSCITYSNDAKINVLGVNRATIEEFGAVSEQTVKEMATRVKMISNATYGLATSGIAGPGGGSLEKPVGTICIGLASPNGVNTYKFNFAFPRRDMNKRIFAITALNTLRKELLK